MSRGFIKEDDLELAGTDVPERPISPYPNYVTPNGLIQLREKIEQLQSQREKLKPLKDDTQVSQRLGTIDRDLRYFESRLETSILVEPLEHNHDVILFGAYVEVEDEDGQESIFMIVGEDEADLSVNKVSYVSPIAKALIGRKIGDSVIWQRPAGNIELHIKKFHY